LRHPRSRYGDGFLQTEKLPYPTTDQNLYLLQYFRVTSIRAGQEAVRVAASTRAGQGRSRALAPFRAGQGVRQERLVAQVQPLQVTTRTFSFQSRGESTPNPNFSLTHSIAQPLMPCGGVFSIPLFFSPFPSLQPPRNFQCHSRVCLFSPSLSQFIPCSLHGYARVSDFSSTETPFPPVSYALRVLAAIGISTGSGLCPRRPTLPLSCTWRASSRQRRQFVPDKKRQKRRHSLVPGKYAKNERHRFVPGKDVQDQRHRFVSDKDA
jgi:hypothetical protein